MNKTAKQLVSAALALVLTALCALSAGAARRTVLLGDANRDGEIGVEDARFILRCSVGLEIYDAVDDLLCDVDENGYVEVDDARVVLRCAVGLDSLDGKSYEIDESAGIELAPEFTGYAGDYYLPESEKQENAKLIYKILDGFGWSKTAICATLGNMEQESTINPGIRETGGTGYGLVQWTPGSWYTNWAAKNGYAKDSLEGQLVFLRYTMQTDCPLEYKMWWRTSRFDLTYDQFICSDASLAYLTEAFMRNYERPGIPHLDRRISFAEKWYAFFTELGL